MPAKVKADIKFINAKNITKNPIVLKKDDLCLPSENFTEAKLTAASTGKVPNENASIVVAPVIKLPEDNA